MIYYRIFLVLFGPATKTNNSNIWINNIYDTLIDMGHQVHLCNPQKYLDKYKLLRYSKESTNILAEKIYEEFKKENLTKNFNIFFSYLNSSEVDISLFSMLNKKVFIINYTTNFHQFHLYNKIAKLVDLNIYVNQQAKQGFDRINTKSYWMPLAVNEKYYLKHKKNKKIKSISFVGSCYGIRPHHIWRILQSDINLNVFGYGWIKKKKIKDLLRPIINSVYYYLPNSYDVKERKYNYILNEIIRQNLVKNYSNHIHDIVSDIEYIHILSTSKIAINIQQSRFNHDFANPNVLICTNLRDFEVPILGTFLCTQYSKEIEQFYEIGSEICTFRNEFELIDKLKYFIKHDSERQVIANKGFERVIREHTWTKRFEQFFTYLENQYDL